MKGERENLKELLRQRLVESGWRDQLKIKCKEIISNKGLEKITVPELIEQVTPYARSTGFNKYLMLHLCLFKM